MSSQKHQKNLTPAVCLEAHAAWEFGRFTVDTVERRLTRDGHPVAVTPKAFEALVFLLARRGQLVTRVELLNALWPDTHVGDASVTSIIWMIRQALSGPDLWIETVPKRGYRFTGHASSIRLPRHGDEPVGPRPPVITNIKAYQLYLEGRNLCHAWPMAAFHRSRERFESAVRLEPMYAQAHFGLALYYGIGAAMGLLPPVEAWRNYEVSLATARRLDETLGENYNGLAALHLYLHRDWNRAERAFARAIEINPDDAETRNHYGFSLALFGRADEAVAQVERAIELDPLSVRFHRNLAAVFLHSRRYDHAIQQCRRTLDLDPTYLHVHALMGDAYEQKGDIVAALRHWHLATGDNRSCATSAREFWLAQLDDLVSRTRNAEFVPAMQIARIHARLGNVDDTMDCLSRARNEPSRLVLELPLDPLFRRFVGNPRFDALIAELPNGQVTRPTGASCGNRP